MAMLSRGLPPATSLSFIQLVNFSEKHTYRALAVVGARSNTSIVCIHFPLFAFGILFLGGFQMHEYLKVVSIIFIFPEPNYMLIVIDTNSI